MEKLNEKVLTAIILADPITRKGKRYLKELKLDISEEYYYEHLRVKSKYENSFYYECDEDSDIIDFDKKKQRENQHSQIKREYDKFKIRFKSEDPDTCPLLLVGVAGNGKTIEVNRQLWMMKRENECEYIYFDLEEVETDPFFATAFHCPDKDNPVWLFCTKLLDGIMKYILKNVSQKDDIYNVFTNTLSKAPAYLGDREHEVFFSRIKDLNPDNPETIRAVFESLISFVDVNKPTESTSLVLRALLYIVFCSSPSQKHYIVFDNIESFIKIDRGNIQIPDEALRSIYSEIKFTSKSVITQFDRISPGMGWRTFKIVVAVRRTSLDLLEPRVVQNVAIPKENIADLTGHFQLDDIWEKKANNNDSIWSMIKNSFLPDNNNERIKNLADIVLTHRKKAVGWSYQSMIAPLMSHGIRRNAKAQAHAIICTYNQLTRKSTITINYDTFMTLYNNSRYKGVAKFSQIRYMMRRALIEQQFKWAIYHMNDYENISYFDESIRWSELGIGHLQCDREGNLVKKNKSSDYIPREELTIVKYYDRDNISLLRRILTYLSYYQDRNPRIGGFGEKTVVEMFKTISLYDLMKGVMIDPIGRENLNEGNDIKLEKKQLIPFARVLLALSNMSNAETKGAPFVILNLKRNDKDAEISKETFAGLLKNIWDKGKEYDSNNEVLNCHYFGARITDAGHAFLIKWLPSYSFIESLYCFDVPSLFFLKDVSTIKHVIKTVYDSASFLCSCYKREAEVFCDNNNDLKDKMYLPKIKNREVTFSDQVKEMHINHLNLYKTYLDNNSDVLGLKKEEKKDILSFIQSYIEGYSENAIFRGGERCF